MSRRLKFFLVILTLIAAFSLIAVAVPQQITSGGAFTMVQGGNVAQVTAAGAQKVDGSAVTQPVSGTFWQATQAVSGTFWQATQPVSGPLTDAQLRASAVPVTGSFSTAPLTACAGTNYDSGIITLPNTSTTLTATPTCVTSITLFNLTTSSQFCSVTDGQGSPLNLIPPGFELSPKADITFNRNGLRAVAGIKWSCTNASAVAGFVRGNQ